MQGQHRILSADKDKVELGWQVVKQKGEGFVNFQAVDGVIIVEDQDKLVR